jgi:hypothetical protein
MKKDCENGHQSIGIQKSVIRCDGCHSFTSSLALDSRLRLCSSLSCLSRRDARIRLDRLFVELLEPPRLISLFCLKSPKNMTWMCGSR